MRPDFLRSLTGLLLKLALAPRFAAPRPSALGDTRSAIRGSRTGANTPKSRVDHFELRKALQGARTQRCLIASLSQTVILAVL